MKKSMLSAIIISAVFSLLVLAGCDDPVNGNDDWLADTANPFIGTWKTETTNMQGVKTTTTREFKTDGTIVVTTKQGENDPVSSTSYYLVKDDILVISQTNSPYYTKHRFSVIDNNNIKLVEDLRGSTALYTREGEENPDVNRTTVLATAITGYWRSKNTSGATMYDWYNFSNDGTYHVYHWMNDDPHYIDRGEFGYYIDSADNFVSITGQYTVRVFTGFTRNDSSTPNTIGWTDESAKTFYTFDGETFAIP
ncbi:MAG: hypothetical protein LBP76_08710 [Treponema sp.]|jgi:hypothetical protein|nr:hypothetical protein [Treponema sp.]